MSAPAVPSPAAFPRRVFLTASAAAAALLVAGCTSGGGAPAVTAQQVDQLAGQLAVQETLVAAFATATQADPALGTEIADLTAQVQTQLDRLKAAAPGPSGSSTAAPSSVAPPAGADPRGWLRSQVAAAATSHAAACLDQTGARAALLGSIAAGLRGQDVRFACGAPTMADDGSAAPTEVDERTETTTLREALAAEHTAVWGYGVVGAGLPGTGRQPAVDAEGTHRDLRDRLTGLLDQRKADPVPAKAAYALPFPVLSAVDAAHLAVVLEDGVAAAWVRVLDQAASRDARQLAVDALSGAEVRAVGWRSAAGQTPVNAAFPGLPG